MDIKILEEMINSFLMLLNLNSYRRHNSSDTIVQHKFEFGELLNKRIDTGTIQV